MSCRRARTTAGKAELRCTLRVPARATATSIRLTAKAGKKVVARRTLRLRNRSGELQASGDESYRHAQAGHRDGRQAAATALIGHGDKHL